MHPALRHFYYSSSRGGYSEAVTAWLAKVNESEYTAPDATFLSVLDALLATELETGTVFSRMKTGNIYGFGSIEAGTVNFKDPDVYQHTLVNAPTYLAANGVKSDGTSYINTGYKINEYEGIETDLTVSIYVSESSTDVSATRNIYGARSQAASSGTAYRISPLATGTTGARQRYGSQDTFASSDHQGHYIETYSGAQSILYKDWNGTDGVKDAQTVTPAVPDLPNDTFFLAYNQSGLSGGASPTNYYPFYGMWLFRFDRFSDDDAIAWKAACDTFLTAVS